MGRNNPCRSICIAREKDNGNYGLSEMDPSCDGADIARAQRYVTDVTTTGAIENLNYHVDGPVEDGSQYADATDMVLKVEQGQESYFIYKMFRYE